MANKTCGECKHYVLELKRCNLRKIICNIQPTDTGCSCFEQKPIPKPTNGDVIRQMSNEVIAEHMCVQAMCDFCPAECKTCGRGKYPAEYCRNAWLAWLNAPADCVTENSESAKESEGKR